MPEPVQQYLRAVGVVGRQSIRTARLEQKGVFRRGDNWLPFTADQYFTTNPPGFVWQAKVQFLPMLNFSVTDMFVNGHGRLQAKLLSFFKVADARGPETDQGELLRYLAEIAWFPTGWLSPYIEWESMDQCSAKATLRLSGLSVSAVVHFDDEYRLSRVTAERHMEEASRFPLREWSGQMSDYRPIAGLLVPFRATATWHLASGDLEYFRVKSPGSSTTSESTSPEEKQLLLHTGITESLTILLALKSAGRGTESVENMRFTPSDYNSFQRVPVKRPWVTMIWISCTPAPVSFSHAETKEIPVSRIALTMTA